MGSKEGNQIGRQKDVDLQNLLHQRFLKKDRSYIARTQCLAMAGEMVKRQFNSEDMSALIYLSWCKIGHYKCGFKWCEQVIDSPSILNFFARDLFPVFFLRAMYWRLFSFSNIFCFLCYVFPLI